MGQRNIYYDYFAEQYELFYSLPYQNKKADFVQLAKLFQGMGERLTVENWRRAVANYFASELGNHTLADLCCRFVPFWHGPLDRYGKPKRTDVGDRPEQSSGWQMWLLMECWKLARGNNKAQVDAACELIENGVNIRSEAEARSEIERIKGLSQNADLPTSATN